MKKKAAASTVEMTGKREAVEFPLAKRPAAQHKPEAPRRTKRAAEVTTARPRRTKRIKEPAPPALPPKREASNVRARAPLPHGGRTYVLRNRIVPKTSKPIIVPSSTSDSEPALPPVPDYDYDGKEPQSKQTSTCAQLGLEYYNSMNQGDEHELVKAVDSNCFIFNGPWIHANFLAKRKGATSCPDLVPKYFFAELRYNCEGLYCMSCVKMDPGVLPRKFGGCGVCPRQIMHPIDGGYRNAQPFNHSARAGNCVITF